jgi:hypothetical protein
MLWHRRQYCRPCEPPNVRCHRYHQQHGQLHHSLPGSSTTGCSSSGSTSHVGNSTTSQQHTERRQDTQKRCVQRSALVRCGLCRCIVVLDSNLGHVHATTYAAIKDQNAFISESIKTTRASQRAHDCQRDTSCRAMPLAGLPLACGCVL